MSTEGRSYSVIIPLYNKEAYILRAVDSVLQQSYRNFEIIVVDDGSSDQGPSKVESLQLQNLHLIKQSNGGVSEARNVGVAHAKFNHVAFLDADDAWDPDFLQEINKLVTNFPEAGLYGTNNFFEYSDGRKIVEPYDELFEGNATGILLDYFATFARHGKSPFCNSSCCYPKGPFLILGGYRSGVILTEDSDLWCRIALRYAIAYSKKPLATYHFETLGNTHAQFQAEDFQVSLTLQEALANMEVKPVLENSVRSLIAFQQINLIKRAIMAGRRIFALKKILEKKFWQIYPLKMMGLFTLLFVPTSLLHAIKRRRLY